MAKGKKARSKEDSALQKHRTAKNKVQRYTSLLSERPSNKHVSAWQGKLAKAESALK